MNLKLSLIIMLLLCVILTISSRSKKHEAVGNANTQSAAAAISRSNPNQNQNENGFRDQQGESRNIHNPTSQYTGVCWHKNNKKWQAQLRLNEKLYFGGLFDNQKDAAMSVNKLCDQYAIKRKNPTIDIKLFEAYQVHNSTSQYTGVSWNKRDKKWQTHLRFNEKVYYGGLFNKEEDAAMKTNLLCDEFGMERKNPAVDIELIKTHQVQNSTSQYIGVCWNSRAKKWEAALKNKHKKHYGGLFDNEEDAAMSVNLLCDKFEVERKNPTIDKELFVVQKHTSIYTCVSWNKKVKKWQTELMHKRKQYFGGLFDKEEHAAIKINLLCDKLGIKRKNPMVIIEPDAIQQNGNKHLINTSKKKNPKKTNNNTRVLRQKKYNQSSKKLLLSSKDEKHNIESSEDFSDKEDNDANDSNYLSESNDEVCFYSENEDDTETFHHNDSTKNEKRKRDKKNKFTLESLVVIKSQGLNNSKKEHKIEEKENQFARVFFHEDMLKKK